MYGKRSHWRFTLGSSPCLLYSADRAHSHVHRKRVQPPLIHDRGGEYEMWGPGENLPIQHDDYTSDAHVLRDLLQVMESKIESGSSSRTQW